MGGPETVLDSPKQAMAGEAVTLESEHRIHQMFKHLGTRKRALLGDMAHQQQGSVLTLRQSLQSSRTFPDLGDGTRCTGQFGIMQRLDTVNDRHLWPQSLQFLKNQFKVCLRQQLQIATVDC